MKTVLIINSGSTSLKYKLFSVPSLNEKAEGNISNIGEKKSQIKNHDQAFRVMLLELQKEYINLDEIVAVGHRVVHGGEEFVKPTVVNSRVLKRLAYYNKLAPLHNPHNLSGIRASNNLLKKVPDVAVFDTAFHRTLPKKASRYAVPNEYYKKFHLRRFGFHGISHQYVADVAAKKLKKPLSKLKIITCHLGGGASITAINKGKSVDTSMGFTPLEGLVMMTRSGDLDPSIPLYLEKQLKKSPNQIDHLLNFESGLLGLSG